MRRGLTEKPWALFLLVLMPVMVSCATVVTFDVKHPPLVDLRNVNTITVIPFEWDSVREQAWLSRCVTTALLNGLRRGNIEIVDPYTLEDSRGRNYGQYADVYIIGRITNINTYDQVETKNDAYSYQTMIREVITRTAIVDIEYSYIRSADNKALGNFRKTETATATFEQTRYREEDTNRNTGRDTGRNTSRNTARDTTRDTGRDTWGTGRGRDGSRGAFPQRGTWRESTAESAIAQFSDTMNYELGPWTTTEKRNLKRRTGDEPLAAEAKHYIEQHKYNEALTLYKTIYEQNGNVFAGYNAAVLLAANEQFPAALGLLEHVRDERRKEGKTIPLFIKNEIKKIAGFINGFTILEAYKTGGVGTTSTASASVPETSQNTAAASAGTATAPAAAAPTTATPSAREIAGTVNINPAMVYALNGSVASIDDDSIFPKMVAYADAVNGRWSMRLPDAAPTALSLLVTDGYRDYYITKTAISISDNISGTIILNTAGMTRLN
jgi:hypothetical protein